MDVTSYLLGKQAGGGSTPTLQEKSVTITENGTTNVTADTGYDGLSEVEITTNVDADVSDYFEATIGSGSELASWSSAIKKLPAIIINTSNGASLFNQYKGTTLNVTFNKPITNISNMFYMCENLTSIPQFTTSNLGNSCSSTFQYCRSITSIPSLDCSTVTYFASMFSNCSSLENIDCSGLDFSSNARINISANSLFSSCSNLKTVTNLDTSHFSDISSLFNQCSQMVTAPSLDTSNATTFANMFYNCTNLENIPIYDTSSLNSNNSFYRFVESCRKLTDTSLDNILQMCVNAINYSGTKKLTTIGISTYYYPASRIQALPHYQDFIDAGWTIS